MTSFVSVGQANETPSGTKSENEAAVIIIGASYAAGWPISSIRGMPVQNAGIGGNESFEMLARFEADVVARKPDIVFIWGFINDIHRSQPAERQDAVARIKASYESMCTQAKNAG